MFVTVAYAFSSYTVPAGTSVARTVIVALFVLAFLAFAAANLNLICRTLLVEHTIRDDVTALLPPASTLAFTATILKFVGTVSCIWWSVAIHAVIDLAVVSAFLFRSFHMARGGDAAPGRPA